MFFDTWKLVTREPDSLLRIDIPKNLETYHDTETTEWMSIHFSKIHSWSMGSQTPWRTRMQLLILAPGIDPAKRQALLNQSSDALEHCTDVRWLKRETLADKEWATGECRHSVNSLENPSWIADVLDVTKGMRITLRVWKKDLELEKARHIVERAAVSCQPLPALAAKFADLADEPRRADERLAAKIKGLDATLTSLGFPTLIPGQVQSQDGFVYMLTASDERDLTIARPIGDLTTQHRPVNESIPGNLENGGVALRNDADLFWFVKQEGEWRQHSSHANYYIPAPMMKHLATRHTDPSKAYFYVCLSVRMRDADSWNVDHLRKWTDLARRAEAQFSRGEIITP